MFIILTIKSTFLIHNIIDKDPSLQTCLRISVGLWIYSFYIWKCKIEDNWLWSALNFLLFWFGLPNFFNIFENILTYINKNIFRYILAFSLVDPAKYLALKCVYWNGKKQLDLLLLHWNNYLIYFMPKNIRCPWNTWIFSKTASFLKLWCFVIGAIR